MERDGEQRGGGGDGGARGGEGEQPPLQRGPPRRRARARGPHLPARWHLIRLGENTPPLSRPLAIDGDAEANWTSRRGSARCAREAIRLCLDRATQEGGKPLPTTDALFLSPRDCVQSPQRRGKGGRGREEGFI